MRADARAQPPRDADLRSEPRSASATREGRTAGVFALTALPLCFGRYCHVESRERCRGGGFVPPACRGHGEGPLGKGSTGQFLRRGNHAEKFRSPKTRSKRWPGSFSSCETYGENDERTLLACNNLGALLRALGKSNRKRKAEPLRRHCQLLWQRHRPPRCCQLVATLFSHGTLHSAGPMRRASALSVRWTAARSEWWREVSTRGVRCSPAALQKT